jgi:hypothetical protein
LQSKVEILNVKKLEVCNPGTGQVETAGARFKASLGIVKKKPSVVACPCDPSYLGDGGGGGGARSETSLGSEHENPSE